MRFLRQLQIVLILGGLAFFGLNFANPKVRQESIKAIAVPLQVKPALPVEDAEPVEARYVKIDGQLYPYNPKNVYNVNGVMTMYKNGEPKKTASATDSTAPESVGEMPSNPVSVYTPGGAKAVLDGAAAAAAALDRRNQVVNKALKHLDKE